MSLALTTSNTATRMTSAEIADMVEKRHDNVRRTIETLAGNGVISTPQIEEVNNNQSLSPNSRYKVYVFQGEQGKRDSIVVVAQLSPQFTARLVDRWQELESRVVAPAIPNFSDPIAAARAWADAKESEQKAMQQLETAKPAVEFVGRFVESTGSKGIRETAKLLRANEREFIAFLTDHQIMYRLGGRLTPYSQHLDAGRFEVKAGVAQNEHAYTTARFTPKGIQWIAGMWIARKIGGEA